MAIPIKDTAPKFRGEGNAFGGDPPRYGRRNVAKMIRQVETLRQAIRSQGTPDIQEAWDAVEEHIDYAYSNPRKDE